jgi:hypothetical protein
LESQGNNGVGPSNREQSGEGSGEQEVFQQQVKGIKVQDIGDGVISIILVP